MDTVVCVVCYETFRDPRVVACGHTFCLDCLKKINPTGVKCPLCGFTTKCSPDKLAVNYMLKTVAENSVSPRKSSAPSPIPIQKNHLPQEPNYEDIDGHHSPSRFENHFQEQLHLLRRLVSGISVLSTSPENLKKVQAPKSRSSSPQRVDNPTSPRSGPQIVLTEEEPDVSRTELNEGGVVSMTMEILKHHLDSLSEISMKYPRIPETRENTPSTPTKRSKSWKLHSHFGTRGSQDSQFHNPCGIAVSPIDGAIVVADYSNHRIQIFEQDGSFVKSFGSFGSGEGELTNPRGVVVDNHGNIFVADTNNHRIQMFSSEGKFMTSFGSFGKDDKQLSYPFDLDIDRRTNVLVVADTHNNSIKMWTTDGGFLRTIRLESDDMLPIEVVGVRVSQKSGNIYVVDNTTSCIRVYDGRSGEPILKFGSHGDSDGQFLFPTRIALDEKHGIVAVTDMTLHSIQFFHENGQFIRKLGRFGHDEGEFNQIWGVAFDSDSNLFACDWSNNRVQIFA
eukprot:TRINITY_DN5389_c0_g1_i2.p1 TRINITY_DN5389_c0_g1~~TRINITY_DN5389_c0_g1_i2.p1  ORF type:complete len:506 (+),score=99.59 TRINITY_DN5389_c0_g1_i2:227-1744(+)